MHRASDSTIFDLLDRYFGGEASVSERRRAEALLADPAIRARVDAVLGRDHVSPVDAEYAGAQWDRRRGYILGAQGHGEYLIDVDDRRKSFRGHSVPRRRFVPSAGHVAGRLTRRVGLWVTACALLVIGAGIVVRSGWLSGWLTSRGVGASRTYATGPGERAMVRLSDGTTVSLAPRTTLVVDPDFGTANRALQLTGHAYFQVATATGSPFIVRVGGVMTRVLGTSFDVVRYPGDASTRIAVLSGKVAVSASMSAHGRGWSDSARDGLLAPRSGFLILSGGTAAQIGDSIITETVIEDPASYIAWTHGALTFREMPVPEVLAVIGHWYGYHFRIADSNMASRRLTAVFEGESRAEVFRSLETLLNITMDFDDTVVTVRPGGGRSESAHPARQDRKALFETLNSEVGR